MFDCYNFSISSPIFVVVFLKIVVNLYCCATTTIYPSLYVFILQNWNSIPINHSSSFPFAQPLTTINLHFVSMILISLSTSLVESYNMCFSVCLSDISEFKVQPYSSMCQNLLPFLRMNDIPLHTFTMLCLSIHPWIDIWIESMF